MAVFAWLTTEYGLAKFGDTLSNARANYLTYILKQEPEEDLQELRKGFCEGQILGDDSFRDDLQRNEIEYDTQEIPLEAILEAACSIYQLDQAMLASPLRSDSLCIARGSIATLARQKGISLHEVSKVFHRDASSLSRLVQRFATVHVKSEETKLQHRKMEEMADSFAIMHA